MSMLVLSAAAVLLSVFLTLFSLLMNPWIQQPCSSFPFFLEHMCVDVITSLNLIEFVTANA